MTFSRLPPPMSTNGRSSRPTWTASGKACVVMQAPYLAQRCCQARRVVVLLHAARSVVGLAAVLVEAAPCRPVRRDGNAEEVVARLLLVERQRIRHRRAVEVTGSLHVVAVQHRAVGRVDASTEQHGPVRSP